jgi:hypothetical protein
MGTMTSFLWLRRRSSRPTAERRRARGAAVRAVRLPDELKVASLENLTGKDRPVHEGSYGPARHSHGESGIEVFRIGDNLVMLFRR